MKFFLFFFFLGFLVCFVFGGRRDPNELGCIFFKANISSARLALKCHYVWGSILAFGRRTGIGFYTTFFLFFWGGVSMGFILFSSGLLLVGYFLSGCLQPHGEKSLGWTPFNNTSKREIVFLVGLGLSWFRLEPVYCTRRISPYLFGRGISSLLNKNILISSYYSSPFRFWTSCVHPKKKKKTCCLNFSILGQRASWV